MDVRRLRAGELLLTVSAVALFGSLFLDWRTGATGWQAFAVADVLLVLAALFALVCVVLAATQPTPAVSISAESLCVLVGLAASLVALVKALGGDVAGGAYVGLAAALGVFVMAIVAIRDERLSPAGRHTDMTGRPVSAPPEVEVLSPPEGSA
jgi:CDP-diglyceride synthetase